MKMNLLFILSLVLTMSCKSNKTTQHTAKMENEESVLIAKGNLYGSGEESIEKQNLVIDNEKDWKNLLRQMNSVNNVTNGFSETEINFSEYTIIAIFADVKGTGGHQIELDISTTSEQKMVTVNHIAPKGMATTVMTQPYYIAKMTKSDLPIVFQ